MSTARNEYTSRIPPSMKLSDGSATSMTAPPKPISLDVPPSQRAQDRFAVRGNAIITGGAGGLAIFDLHPDEAQNTINKLQPEFPRVTIVFRKVDVTDPESVAKAIAEVETTLGSIDVLLCFAGIAGSIHALDMSLREFQKMFEINTTGAFLCSQAAAKSMVKSGKGGSIILMASISAHSPNFPRPQVHYNASKAPVLSMKASLAAEWARYGIRVNSISPGYMDTILNEGPGLEEHRQTWVHRNPYGRMGQPEELTGAIVLLASKAGNYITGADILVDGGLTIF